MDHRQPRTLANAQSFPEEFENLQDLRVRELRVEERGALELGEAGPAPVAVEESMMALAESAAHSEIASVTLPMARTLGILAAKPGKAGGVVHDGERS